MEPLKLCDCCLRCKIHCLCDEMCENEFTIEIKDGKYCKKCWEIEQNEA